MKALSAFLLAAIGCAHASVPASGPPQPRTASIVGRVYDAASGLPLEGATVVAQGAEGELGDITDASGSYNIANLSPGSYLVRFYYANVKVEREITATADAPTWIEMLLQTARSLDETCTIINDHIPPWDEQTTNTGVTLHHYEFLSFVPTR